LPAGGELAGGELAGGELAGGELAGDELAGGELAGGEHGACVRRAALEPPRYCSDCGRRMVVQVSPMGWRARCSRHGERRG